VGDGTRAGSVSPCDYMASYILPASAFDPTVGNTAFPTYTISAGNLYQLHPCFGLSTCLGRGALRQRECHIVSSRDLEDRGLTGAADTDYVR